MPGLVSYPWEACSFLKENRGAVDLGKRDIGDSGRRESRRNYSKDVLKIIFKKEILFLPKQNKE